MSMLAERKRKQKFIVIPKGTATQNIDTSNVAWKMMQRMGWSIGKGLGADESGMKEYIRVRYKNDTSGVGFKDSEEDDKSSDFNALLASLQATNGTVNNNQPASDQMKPASLEEKSQKSRARVHYKKFTRGKDLSRYSEKDLANIFGKKSLRKLTADTGKADADAIDDVSTKNAPAENGHLKNCGSITDYFKSKSKANKKIFDSEMRVTKLQVDSDQEISFEGDQIETRSACYENSCFDENDNSSNNIESNDSNLQSQFEIVRKLKKKKMKDININTYENQALDVTFDENCTGEIKKKKKSKKSKKDCFENPTFDFNDDSTQNDDSSNDFEVKRKTKTAKSENVADNLDENDETGRAGFEVKKKTKKKRSDGGVFENLALNISAEESEIGEIENLSLGTPKSDFEVKRKAKSKHLMSFENSSFDLKLDDNSNVSSDFEVKRKTKKAKKRKNVDCFENPGLNLSSNDLGESNGTPLKRKKSVRFSNVNQEHIIPNIAEQQQWENEELYEINSAVMKKNGFENIGFDLHKASLEENIDSITKTIDKYQAEIENDINEAKVAK